MQGAAVGRKGLLRELHLLTTTPACKHRSFSKPLDLGWKLHFWDCSRRCPTGWGDPGRAQRAARS